MSSRAPGLAARGPVVVIDPARRTPELPGFNRLARVSPVPLSYHLPAMHGMRSLQEEDMHTARGVIILGSASSVNDREAWQLTLESWLHPHLERGLPAFGICYGMQMLAYMFGGAVGYVGPEQKKYVGLRAVQVDATACWPAASGLLVVSHNEMVSRVPDCMQVIARTGEAQAAGPGESASAVPGTATVPEAIAHRTLPIWAFQSHPEATASFFAESQEFRGDLGSSLGFGDKLLAGFLAFASTR